MKKIIFLFVIGLFFGCGPSKAELEAAARKALDEAQGDTTSTPGVVPSADKSQILIEKVTQIMKPDGEGGGSLRFIAIDGHDYIQWYTGSSGSSDIAVAMVHNENCSNEIHTINK